MLRFLKRLIERSSTKLRDTIPPLPPTFVAAQRRVDLGLQHDQEHFEHLVAGVRDYAVFLLDREGTVLTWNTGAEHIKGYRQAEIVGQHFSRFYTSEAVASGWPAHELTVSADTGRFEDDGWRVRKDGTKFWANVVITALRDERGKVRGFLKITRDLTDRRQAEESARHLLQEAAARKAAEESAQEIERQPHALVKEFLREHLRYQPGLPTGAVRWLSFCEKCSKISRSYARNTGHI